MLLKIDELKGRPRQIEIDEQAANFEVLHELIDQGALEFKAPVRGLLNATWAGSIIEVAGQLETTVILPCGRCLTPVASHLVIDVLICYSDLADDDGAAAEELEVRGEELGLITYTGTEIDLRPDVEQDIIMALPQQLLCADDCRGLCPTCGIDLNQGQCQCERPVFHAGLAALKNFRIE